MLGIKGKINDILVADGWQLIEDKGKTMRFGCSDKIITISVKDKEWP